ncbi:DUF3526 domain-containing protein [Massilia sp. DWR3-1-1]|uniref:DUF3526 domain-containing protein n=1 Tax=Massilia sp. DWR3-1-1 TaxID=2804559 RepID=UPI003CF62E01
MQHPSLSDLEAQLAYQDRIAAFHETVRNFHYPYIFGDRPLSAADAARTPRFVPASAAGSSVLPALAVQCLSGALMLGLAALLLRRRRDGP